MAWYPARGGGIPASVKTDMNAVLNKKFGTSAQTYPPKEWAEDVNLMGLLPIRTASGSVAHFEDGADDVPMKSVVANIVPIQSGTGDPSPSNPRPISGTDELTLVKIGANLLDGEKTADSFVETVSTPTNTYKGTDTDGKYLSFFASYAINQKTFFSIPFKANTQYSFILKMKKDNSSNASNLAFVYTDGTRVQLTAPTTPTPNEVFTFVATSSSTKNLARIEGFYASGRSFLYYEESGVFEGVLTTADFEPYKGTTYPISLGQTVYGGSAEVVGGTGTITHELITLDGSEAWNVHGSIASWFYLDGAFHDAFIDGEKNDFAVCNCGVQAKYQNVSGLINGEFALGLTGNRIRFVFKNTDCATIEDFKTWLSSNNMQVAYTLATPGSFTFTGQPINSYLGVNNLYVDSGEVLDVEYRADIDLLLASLQGNRGLQMTRTTPTEETQQTEEETENEDQR